MKVQARIALPPDVRREIDRVRLACNPERAAGNPAHVTVAYQGEAPDPVLLVERVRQAAARDPAVPAGSRVGGPVPASVADPGGGVAAVRGVVLAPPFTRRGRSGCTSPCCTPTRGSGWRRPAFVALPPVGEFVVTELQVVGPGNAVLAVFPLAPDAEPSAAVDGGG